MAAAAAGPPVACCCPLTPRQLRWLRCPEVLPRDACDGEAVAACSGVAARGRCGWLVAAFGSWPRLEVALQRRCAREGLHGCGSGFQG